MPNFRREVYDRQGRFRDSSPTVSEEARCAIGPNAAHRHSLAHGYEDENLYPPLRGENGARRFFRERGISWHRDRLDNFSGKAAPTRNMASSQVACVNFLLPLAEIPGALTSAIRAIDSDVREIVEISHEGRNSPVELEWIGMGQSLEGKSVRGMICTNADAFLVADTDRLKRAYVMEWKYSERFEEKDMGSGKSGQTRRCIYSPLFALSSSFRHKLPMDALFHESLYQLLRLRLLADRMVRERDFGVSEAKVVVVVPERNEAYRKPRAVRRSPLNGLFPQAETVSDIMRAALRHPDRDFAMVCPTTLLGAVASDPAAASWADYMRGRYGF